MQKIDIHLHLALNSRVIGRGIKICSSEEMIPHLHSLDIGHGVILPTSEENGGNEEAKAICEKNPETYHWMCNLDFANQETIMERLEKYKSQGAIGIGELVINKPVNHPFIETIFESAEKLNMPVLFHMDVEEGYNYGIVDQPRMPLLEEALKKFPNLTIIGHSQPFWHEITGEASNLNEERNSWGKGPVTPGGRLPYLLKNYSNLYGDLSANSGGQAIMRDEEFGLAFLEEFQDQLMFGTDMANTEMVFSLGKWLDDKVAEGKLSREVYEKICWKNAKRILNI